MTALQRGAASGAGSSVDIGLSMNSGSRDFGLVLNSCLGRMAQSLTTGLVSAHKMSICRSAISFKIANAGRFVLR